MSAPIDLGALAPPGDAFHLELGRRLKTERQRRNLTLKDIEERVGISATHLSEIERGKSSPTIGVLERIARALGTRASLLVETSAAVNYSHVRRGERRTLTNSDGSIRYDGLSKRFSGAEMSLLLVTFSPGSRARSNAHEGEEILHVIEGSILAHVDKTEYRLEAGDTLHFHATGPHHYACPPEGPAVAILATRPCYAL